MSNRLDQEREEKLQPIRMKECKERLESIGFNVYSDEHTKLIFTFKGSKIVFYPYSGWHAGKSINDGRGFKKLLKQLWEEK